MDASEKERIRNTIAEVSAEEVERWSGTDRSTRWRRWWLQPDGMSRWDLFRMRVGTRLIIWFGRDRECGCRVLTEQRLRFWCVDCMFAPYGAIIEDNLK